MNLIKFYSDSCAPCKLLSEALEDLGVEHTSVNIREDFDIALNHQVRSVPVLLDTDSGERFIGHSSKPKLEAWIDSIKD